MKLETRHAVLASTLAISGCLSGVAFGWAALVVMLKREGAYEELCDRSADDDGACAAQEVALSRVFSIGILCLFASRLPIGVAVDRLGSRATTAGTCAVAAAGSLCLAERFYGLGFGLLAGAGPGVHLGAMHVSNLFPEAKRTALGAYSTAHQCSTFVFSLWLPLFNAGASLRQLFRGYAALLLVFGAGARRRGRATSSATVARCARRRGARRGAVAAGPGRGRVADGVRGAAPASMNLAFNVFASFLGLLIAAPLVGPILDRRDDGVALIARGGQARASTRSWPWSVGDPSRRSLPSTCVGGRAASSTPAPRLVRQAPACVAASRAAALRARRAAGLPRAAGGGSSTSPSEGGRGAPTRAASSRATATRVVDAGGAELDGAELAPATPNRAGARRASSKPAKFRHSFCN
ncbi:major facilitator superfamily-like protein [Aureococcus anophagefferens]|nr:major facilitator superfamily-like protein [Aureococcus anophagefferens]